MRAFGFISILVGLSLVAYLSVKQQEGPEGINGPGVGQSMAQAAKDKASRMAVRASMQSVESALEVYRAERNAYPDRLKDLVDAGYLPSVPDGIRYDSRTGEVFAD